MGGLQVEPQRLLLEVECINLKYDAKIRAAGNISGTTLSNLYTATLSLSNPTFSLYPTSPNNDTNPTWGWNAVSGATHYAYRLSDNNGSSYQNWSAWSTDLSYSPSIINNTTYRLQVKCKDSEGIESSVTTSISYTLDTVAPSNPIFIIQPISPSKHYNQSWKISPVAGASQYSYRLSENDGTTYDEWSDWAESYNYQFQFLLTKSGSYRLQIKCRDDAGNESQTTTSDEFKLDLQAPDAPTFIQDPTNETQYGTWNSWYDTNVSWIWDAVEGADTYRFRMVKDGTNGPWITTSSRQISLQERFPSGVSDASYVVQVQAVDEVGNISGINSSKTYKLDRSPPPTPIWATGVWGTSEPASPLEMIQLLHGDGTLRISSTMEMGWIQSKYDSPVLVG